MRSPSHGDDLEVGPIECMVHIGVDDEERAARQRVLVDVILEGVPPSPTAPALSGKVESWVRRYLESGRFVLIEAASLGLARIIFDHSPARRVFVRFRKFVLPDVDHVAVEMTFDRQQVSATPSPCGGDSR